MPMATSAACRGMRRLDGTRGKGRWGRCHLFWVESLGRMAGSGDMWIMTPLFGGPRVPPSLGPWVPFFLVGGRGLGLGFGPWDAAVARRSAFWCCFSWRGGARLAARGAQDAGARRAGCGRRA
eukprot:346090-Chlamydomonas_euryale.AAC.17